MIEKCILITFNEGFPHEQSFARIKAKYSKDGAFNMQLYRKDYPKKTGLKHYIQKELKACNNDQNLFHKIIAN